MTSQNKTVGEKEHGDELKAPDENVNAGNSETPLTSATTEDLPAFGWSAYAERINGRFAMVGFTAILLIEAVTQRTFLHRAGF